jgi:hypothetical protein
MSEEVRKSSEAIVTQNPVATVEPTEWQETDDAASLGGRNVGWGALIKEFGLEFYYFLVLGIEPALLGC